MGKWADEFPEHSRTSCNDENRYNAHPSGKWCERCTALVMDATQPPAVGVDVSEEMSAAWRECYSATIKALAVMVTAGAPEGADKWDVVDRSAITGQVIKIREAMDRFNRPFAMIAAAPQPDADTTTNKNWIDRAEAKLAAITKGEP